MTICYAFRITRQMCRDNPEARFVFGDNEVRRGLGGQAKEMRGEPNAIGVATKWKPSLFDDAFFSDDDLRARDVLEHDLNRVEEALAQNRLVVFPRDGIGTGLSQMDKRAPNLFYYLNLRISFMEAKYGLDLQPHDRLK